MGLFVASICKLEMLFVCNINICISNAFNWVNSQLTEEKKYFLHEMYGYTHTMLAA